MSQTETSSDGGAISKHAAELLRQPAKNRGVHFGYDKDLCVVMLDFIPYYTMREAEDYLESVPRTDRAAPPHNGTAA